MFSKIKNCTSIKIATILLLLAFLISIVPQGAFAEKYSFVFDHSKLLSPDEIMKISDQEVEEKLSGEIDKYINRAPDVFEFDNNLKAKVDHRILLISLIKLNSLFCKYKRFSKDFIDYKIKNSLKFKIKVLNNSTCLIDTSSDSISFLPGNMGSYKERIDSINKYDSSVNIACQIDGYIVNAFDFLIQKVNYMRKILPAEIIKISKQEMEERLSIEINKYINRASDVFEFDYDLMSKVDNKILLISLIKFNYLFDKYRGFTEKFIAYKRENHSKFKIKVMTNNIHVMDTNFNFLSFLPGNLSSYEEHITFNCLDSIIGFYSPGDIAYWINNHVIHEFGYLMRMYFVLQDPSDFCDTVYNAKKAVQRIKKNDNKFVKAKYGLEYVKDVLWLKALCFWDPFFDGESKGDEPKAKKIKIENPRLQGVNKVKKDILNSLKSSAIHVKKYGEVSPLEFFTQAFINLECTENPNDLNETSEKLQKLLIYMEFLPSRIK